MAINIPVKKIVNNVSNALKPVSKVTNPLKIVPGPVGALARGIGIASSISKPKSSVASTPTIASNPAATSPKPATTTSPSVKTPAAQNYIQSLSAEPAYGGSDQKLNSLISSNSQPAVSAPTTPMVDPQAAYKKAMDDYITSLSPSSELTKARQTYNDFVASANLGIKNKEGQGRGIPLELVRGQQAKLGDQAQIEAERLQGDIGILEGGQTQTQTQSKARADYEKALLDSTKPTEIGGSLVKFNPQTGQYETVYSPKTKAEDFTLGEGQVRYDSQGNIIASGPAKNEGADSTKILSAGDAQKLGVPYGTTEGEAAAMGITPQKPLTEQAKINKTNAESALRALDTVKNELFGTTDLADKPDLRSNVLTRSKIPLTNFASRYRTAVNEIKDVIARLRTGAALTAEEQRFYESQLPGPTDNYQTVLDKLQRFDQLFKEVAGGQRGNTGGDDLDTALDQVGFKPDPSKSIKGSYIKSVGPVTAYGSPLWKPGLDIDLKKGQPVPSPVNGVVIATKKNGGFGNQVQIRDDKGNEIWLSHLDGFSVKPGQKVTRGTVIGKGGNSGNVIRMGGGDGSHLDVTIKTPKGLMTAKQVEQYIG